MSDLMGSERMTEFHEWQDDLYRSIGIDPTWRRFESEAGAAYSTWLDRIYFTALQINRKENKGPSGEASLVRRGDSLDKARRQIVGGDR